MKEENLLQKTKENLEKRGFCVRVFQTAREAAAYLNDRLDGTSVGIGGSVSVREMGLFPLLNAHNEVWWHNDPAQLERFGDSAVRRRARFTEAYICSVNGLSEAGELVNVDARGNRLAETLYGHKRVYLVVGKNKIAKDLGEAIWRARNIAAPKNAQRLGLKTPCAVKGDRCYNCNSPQRICRALVVIERPVLGQETEIILVEENLGY